MTSTNDSELIIRIRAGDPEGFTELVHKYSDTVYGYCYYRTGNFEDARDLCQDTFVLAYRKIDQLRDTGKFGAWLRKIAENICTKWSRRPTELPVEELEEVKQPQTPEESLRSAFVSQALAGLSENERLAVVMHYVDGLSYSEIADFLEVSPTTVKGRLYQGRQRLKKEIITMTKQEFEDNRLDDESMVASLKKALEDVWHTFHQQEDAPTAQEKFRQLESQMKELTSDSSDARKLRFQVTLWKDQIMMAGEDERWSRRKTIIRAAEETRDAEIIARTLSEFAVPAFYKGEKQEAAELIERAYEAARKHDNPSVISQVDRIAGEMAILSRDLKKAEELFSRALEVNRKSVPGDRLYQMWYLLGIDSQIRALKSLNEKGISSNLLYISYQSGSFHLHKDGPVFYGTSIGEHVFEGFQGNRYLLDMMPPFKQGWPDRFVVDPIKVGKEWTTGVVHPKTGQATRHMTTKLESDNDTVTIKSGTFRNCLRTTSWMPDFRPEDKDIQPWLPVKRTIWFAPGVGIIKSIYQPLVGDPVTSELTDHHITSGTGYVPIAPGNQWRYRWVEGEEQYGYKTDDCIETTGTHPEEEAFLVARYVICFK